MSTVSSTLPAPPGRVFDVLADARTLHYIVVGARVIRRFDPRWPEVGTVVDHSTGVWPLVIRDRTLVLASEPPELLVLEAHVRPLGYFAIKFVLEEDPKGTRLLVEEHPSAGPLSAGPLRAIAEGLIALRNLELCRRLRKLVGQREAQWRVEHAGA